MPRFRALHQTNNANNLHTCTSDKASTFTLKQQQLQRQVVAMGKKRKVKNKELTQEEIWDDSALIQSWDDAVEEYKVGCFPFHLYTIHVIPSNSSISSITAFMRGVKTSMMFCVKLPLESQNLVMKNLIARKPTLPEIVMLASRERASPRMARSRKTSTRRWIRTPQE